MRRTDDPRIVMLTPGPHNETYFEQSYLARYLGFSLVEGQDLTVRDGRVFLKTLSGLEPVDVILRRVDDDFCDPLELKNNSMLGVPGLVEALRNGTVAVAKQLGQWASPVAGVHVFLARTLSPFVNRGVEAAVRSPPGGADRSRRKNTSCRTLTNSSSNLPCAPACRAASLADR